jgi:hypothetical protein
MCSQEHQKIRKNASKKSTKYRSRGGQHGSEVEIEIEIVYNNTRVYRLLSLGPPC